MMRVCMENESRDRCDEPFTKECGPNVPDHANFPLELFFCLIKNDFLEELLVQSNIYIKQQNKKELLTKEELLIFLGINILMGMKNFLLTETIGL